MSTSVVVVTYRRLENLERILKGWLDQAMEVFLADCSNGKFSTDLAITHVRFNKDVGSKARHAAALLTNGDYVIKADDDLLPKPGLVEDFLDNWHQNNGGILGLIGRKFEGPKYYGNTRFCRSDKLEKPSEVDFVGVCTFTSRDNLAFDLRGCESPIEDLFWQMKAFPSVRKWVIPTKNYKNLPECNDKGCLFHDDKARKIREEFYSKYYNKNYKERISGS